MALQANSTKAYYPTEEDRLWLLRAVVAEGKPEPMVARALVNLFMLQRSKGSGQTLSKLVRAYAQPVNPRWFPDGDLHQAALANGQDTAARAAQRVLFSKRGFPFPQHVVAAVQRSLESPYAGDVTDYAAQNVDATPKGYSARSEPTPGFNRLWARDARWRGYAVEAGGALLPLAVALAVLVWACNDA